MRGLTLGPLDPPNVAPLPVTYSTWPTSLPDTFPAPTLPVRPPSFYEEGSTEAISKISPWEHFELELLHVRHTGSYKIPRSTINRAETSFAEIAISTATGPKSNSRDFYDIRLNHKGETG